jgi:hydrogenase maturation factor
MQKKYLPVGKLPATLLKEYLKKFPKNDDSVIIPPGVGLDAAGIKIGEKLVAVTTDPITLTSNQIGTYSVAVNINDVVCLGCSPRWYSASLLLPPNITENEIEEIWGNLACELSRYQISAIGGHTEITKAVTMPVLVGQMIGEAIGFELLDARKGKPGDQVLLWRKIAIEGTALLASSRYETLLKSLSANDLLKMQNFLFNPGICILPLAKKLLPEAGVVAIHDITEGGIATAAHEIAEAANCGINIDGNSIAILEETLTLSEILGFNPLGLIASGSAIIVCRKDNLEKIEEKLAGEEIYRIGELTESKRHIIIENSIKKSLPSFLADEITRFL